MRLHLYTLCLLSACTGVLGSLDDAGASDAGGGSGGGASTGGGGASTGGGGASTGGGGASTGGGGASTGGGGASTGGGGASTGGGTSTGGGSSDVDAGTSVLVVVGYGQRLMHSVDGVSWTMQEKTPNGGDDNDLFRGVTFGHGHFVAVGGSSVALTKVSTDGVHWADGGTGNAWLGGAAYVGPLLIAAGGNGLRTHSNDDGLSWSTGVGYQSIHYRAIVSNGQLVAAVGHTTDGSNQGIIATSVDGVSWVERRHEGAAFGTVAWGLGHFVASGANGLVVTSTDGTIWASQTVGTGGGTVLFDGSAFLLSRDNGLYRSTDGETFTTFKSTTRDISAAFKGAYFSFGWPLDVQRTTDFATWSQVYKPGGSGVSQAVVGAVP